MLSDKGFFPLLIFSLIILFFASCAENSSILDNGQSLQLEFSVKTCNWSSSNSSYSDYKPISRATPISGNTFDASNSFNVIADENKGNSWSTEINNETASYSTASNIWQTSATHYWPGANSTVNFYAYYPTSISSSISHTAGSSPVFSYTVPDNTMDQTDILTSSKTGVAGDSYDQTPIDFKHILAAVNFQVGTNGMPSGTITGVTLNNIQYKGTYSLNGTWTPNTTDKKSFSQIVTASTNAGTTITSGTTTFMMMPQTLGSDANITITYSNGGTLTKTITGTWEAGKAYTYNLSKIIPVANFDYTGGVQSYTVPLSGTYKLEVWGAEGGYDAGHGGGNGGYSCGTVELIQNSILYIVVGGKGGSNCTSSGGGYNGGGNAGGKGSSGGGGGAACIVNNNRGALSNFNSFRSEIYIVAGGGGGGGNAFQPVIGGSGGGTSGGSGYNCSGGTQTTGYTFGHGQDRDVNGDGGGGGGGWYGGYSATADGGGAGGSGYIGGVTNGTMQSGVRSGDGYARITFISAN
jgi:hypothetical protein